MILERLEVAGFRKFAAPFAFEPDERFTVIHAPNGTGKSTLLDAIHYGLLERFGVTGEDATVRFKSAGRELVPSITVQFSVDGMRYRLEKKFLGGKSAELHRFEDSGRFEPFRQGSAADDFVRELFSADPSKKGVLDRSKHLGFAHVLWSPASTRFEALPEAAGDKIRSMLGTEATAVRAGERAVQDLVSAAYLRYYSPNEPRYTTAAGTANIPALQKRVENARGAVTAAREDYGKLEQLTLEFDDRSADAERMGARRAELREQIDAAKAAADEYASIAKRHAEAVAEQERTRAAHARLDETIRALTDARKAHAQAQDARLAAEAGAQRRREALETLAPRVAGARKAVEDANAVVSAVGARSGEVTAAEQYTRDRTDAERLAAILAAVSKDDDDLAAARAERGALLAPTPAELESLRADMAELGKHEATIAASAIALEIDPAADATIDVIAGARPGTLALQTGVPALIEAGDDGLVVDVPGLGRVRARGADGAAKARKKAQELRARLAEVHERFGTADVTELARRSVAAGEITARIDRLEDARAGRLGETTREEAESAQAEATARAAAAERQYPAWATAVPDARALREAFDRDLDAAQSAVTKAAAVAAELEHQRTEAEASRTEADRRVTDAKVALATEDEKIKQLVADGYEDDAARLMAHAAAAHALKLASDARADADVQLAAFPEDPAALRERLAAEEREAGSAAEDAAKQAAIARTKLEGLAQSGAYSKLAQAEEELARLELEVAAAEREADAVKCLRDAFEAIRSARIAAVVKPIEGAATRYFAQIAGRTAGDIRIGSGFTPTGLVEPASGTVIASNQTLSTGETEQMYLSARLALAEVLSAQRGRQLFVLDDALAVTDPNRLRRFLTILEQLSRERLQVIVATADKARYLGITGARHVDLAAELLAGA